MVKLIDTLKEKFDIYFIPIVARLDKVGVNPLHLTILSFIFGLGSAFFLFSNHFLFAVFILMHLLLDKLDGSLARYSDKVTLKGKWLDYILDSCVLLILLIASYFMFPSASKNFFFTRTFVLITIVLYLVLHLVQSFIKRTNTFGSHLLSILLYIFNFASLAVFTTFIISVFGIIFHLHTKNPR
jgi:phosphatidylglycerophosphate synthase